MRTAGLFAAVLMLVASSGVARATPCEYVTEMTKSQAINACKAAPAPYTSCVVVRITIGTWAAVAGGGLNAKAICLGANSSLNSQLNVVLLNSCPKPVPVLNTWLAGGGSSCQAVRPVASPALNQP